MKQEREVAALKMEISTEVVTRLKQLRLAEQTLETFQEGLLKQAEQSLALSETSYRQGEISLLDYLDSQRTYYQILRDYNSALFSWQQHKAALEKAVGEDIQ